MLRLTLLALAVSTLVPLGPLGCPDNQPATEDTSLPDRGTITTTATAPDTAAVADLVQLQATATGATDGGAISYAWLQLAGPGVQLANAATSTASFTAPSLETTQTLRFLVTTTNEAGDVGRAEVVISVTADPDFGTSSGTGNSTGPVAKAGTDQTVAVGATVTLDGSGSTGAALTYRWRQVSGTAVTLTDANLVRATFTAPTYDANGTNQLLFELSVTDGSNRTVSARTQVRIRDPEERSDQVRLTTTLGEIVFQLETEKAPLSVANFLQYVDEGFYNGTLFHRVVPDFVIQGGGFTTALVQKPTHGTIVNEADNGLSNLRGTVAMARLEAPDSATCQFFINLLDNVAGGDGSTNLDPGGITKRGYAVFARVIRGMDVVDAIAAVETAESNGMQNVPTTNVVVRSAKRVTGAAVAEESTD